MLIGAGLRFHFLDSGLWYDEIVTLVESVRRPLASIVTQFPGSNDHLLYSVLGHLSITLFGEHAWSLRLPAALFGVAALPLLYVFGANITSRFEALAATILLTLSYHHLWFSQNARGYTILFFCAVLATHLLIVGLRDNRRAVFVGYAVVSALGAYTHLSMVWVVVGQACVVGGYLLARYRGRIQMRDWINPVLGFVLAGVLTLILYSPLLLDIQASFVRESEGPRVATAGWAIGEAFRGLQVGYATGGGIVLVGLLLTGAWSYLRRSPTVLALFIVPGATLFAATLLLHRPMRPRLFFFLAGFALLIVVRGAVIIGDWLARRIAPHIFGERHRRLLPVAVVAGMTAVSMLALPAAYRYPKQDYEQALRYVEANAGANDLIVVAGAGATFPYQKYYGKPWKRLANAAELATARHGREAVWVIYTFKKYIELLQPDLMKEIVAHCPPVKTFPGTTPDGSIVVTKCAGR